MKKPLSLFIGLRYTRTTRYGRFISFISLVSLLGIALGVMVLITVLSVMNGFDEQIHNRLFTLAPQITITGLSGPIKDWPEVLDIAQKYPDVIGATPYVSGQGLIGHEGQALSVFLTGIDPKTEGQVSALPQKIIAGKLSDLKDGSFGIVIGRELAERLGVMPGDKVNILIPQVTVTPIGIMPRFRRFTVVGVFHAGSGFGFDSRFGFINIKDGQRLFQLGDDVSGVRLKIKNLYQAPAMSWGLAGRLPDTVKISNWTIQYGAFFSAVKMEKTIMFFILLLIIAVAAFNMVSSLVMMVNSKRADIAVLRTMGTTPGTILRIFIAQGCFIGLLGTISGMIAGIILSLNVTSLVNWIERLTNVQFISSNVYFVDYLPSKLEWSDVWHVAAIAMALCFIATLYPARSASKTQPAEALRYE
jgi:lipoprotein-releasing system permease protein